MVHQQLLPNFTLANGNGPERSFSGFLADCNVIMRTRFAEASHRPADELLRSFLMERPTIQFSLDVALPPHRNSRAPPPGRQHKSRRGTAA